MRTRTRLIPLFVLVGALLFAGCASKKQETPPSPVDTTGFNDFKPVKPVQTDTLPSAAEQERRRLEEQRLASERELQEKQKLQTVYFEYDQSSLTREAQNTLRANAEILKTYPHWEVVLEGHCDERGSTEYNLALGERRAATVRQYYSDYGIDAKRIRLISYGEERPAVQGSGEQVWRQNRRAVTIAR